jgi:hypothetical protein
VIYARGWYRQGAPPPGSKHIREEANEYSVVELPSGEIRQYPRIRDIRRYTSKDFRTWSEPEYIDMGSAPLEHLYKNSALAYYRRPDLILMFPKRFVPDRTVHPDYPKPYYPDFPQKWILRGLSDVVFMFSRDGFHFDRRYMEAFLRPGPDPRNWAPRAIQIGPGLVPTGEGEMSVYYLQHFRLPSIHVRRGVLRLDGLVSANAPYEGGELLTKPITYSGRSLVVNYATSAAGSLRVELQDLEGRPLPGCALKDAVDHFGDSVQQVVGWDANPDLSRWAGTPVRIRFVMKDAELYSYRFQQ